MNNNEPIEVTVRIYASLEEIREGFGYEGMSDEAVLAAVQDTVQEAGANAIFNAIY
jgi:hypothetical protein